ncbi:hypothetical protein EGH22_00265 [Halomicroarcula sp. F28]|uniref:hypothetical protein n=1 Tax=Haloarcula salinisoli TaxID=2487746 RepID=UPI001C72A470|nr:hypothetical protein [Halomicroarcula salinisoli]MBX0284750.1 hypothetical protein [Halomicroarcula salinisoli]
MERNTIAVGELIDELRAEFDYVAEIYVWHRLSEFHITVHTGEAEGIEQYIEMPYDRIEVDIGESDPLSVEYGVIATYYGPGHMQGAEGTTVYMSESVQGSKQRDVEEGLTRLRQKLAGTCPTCKNGVDDLSSHYRDNRDCEEDDRV